MIDWVSKWGRYMPKNYPLRFYAPAEMENGEAMWKKKIWNPNIGLLQIIKFNLVFLPENKEISHHIFSCILKLQTFSCNVIYYIICFIVFFELTNKQK